MSVLKRRIVASRTKPSRHEISADDFFSSNVLHRKLFSIGGGAKNKLKINRRLSLAGDRLSRFTVGDENYYVQTSYSPSKGVKTDHCSLLPDRTYLYTINDRNDLGK